MADIKSSSSTLAINAGAPAPRIGAPGQPSIQEWTNEILADLKVAQKKLQKLPAAKLQGAGDRLLRAIDVFVASTPNTRSTPVEPELAQAEPAAPAAA